MLNPADDSFEQTLRETLPEQVFRPISAAYLEEPRGRYKARDGLLLAPGTTEQVSTVVKACVAARVPVVPYGGGTGLVGGQVMFDGPKPVILSFERMAEISAAYPEENVLVAQAGAILANVQQAASDAGRLFPLSLASEGSARVGGLLATNAGGVNVLRYGNARDLCLGLEAVLPDGTIWNGLTRLRKDNTGYDLRNLLIGAEGTLGVITAAALKLHPKPAAEGTALLVVPNPAAALRLLAMAGDQIGGGISAFELIGQMGLTFLADHLPQIRQPFAQPPEWTVLIDFGLARGQSPSDALEALFVEAHDAGIVSDGVIAQSQTQRAELWAVREHIPLANRAVGAIGSHDISLPLGAIPDFIARAGPALAQIGTFRINCFGHLGDGNLHYNVFPMPGDTRDDHDHLRGAIKTCVHDLVHEMGGSFSAEHGVGRLKVDDLERYGDPAKLAAMRALKQALDPNGIMNPGAVLHP